MYPVKNQPKKPKTPTSFVVLKKVPLSYVIFVIINIYKKYSELKILHSIIFLQSDKQKAYSQVPEHQACIQLWGMTMEKSHQWQCVLACHISRTSRTAYFAPFSIFFAFPMFYQISCCWWCKESLNGTQSLQTSSRWCWSLRFSLSRKIKNIPNPINQAWMVYWQMFPVSGAEQNAKVTSRN